MGRGHHGLTFVLFMEISMSPTIECEWCTEEKGPEVVVLIEVCDPVLQFISVKIWLHVSDLDVCLMGEEKVTGGTSLGR